MKHYVAPDGPIAELCAVVTVSDDGGSSGRLRRDFNMLPPGDLRNCIVALAEDEAQLSRLFQYRFSAGEGLEGHSFGNLFLTALTAVTGDFAEAVRAASVLLASRGRIFPSTVSNVQLDAEMADGSRVRGETNITASTQRVVEVRLVPANAQPMPETLEAIRDADLITVGPGSLFTSLVPNLLVRGIPEAMRQSRGLRVYICNLMTQANESLGMSAADHVNALRRHAGGPLFDVVLLNSAPVSDEMKRRYAAEGAEAIAYDPEPLHEMGLRVVSGDFLEESEGKVRHAAQRVAQALIALAADRIVPQRQPSPVEKY